MQPVKMLYLWACTFLDKDNHSLVDWLALHFKILLKKGHWAQFYVYPKTVHTDANYCFIFEIQWMPVSSTHNYLVFPWLDLWTLLIWNDRKDNRVEQLKWGETGSEARRDISPENCLKDRRGDRLWAYCQHLPCKAQFVSKVTWEAVFKDSCVQPENAGVQPELEGTSPPLNSSSLHGPLCQVPVGVFNTQGEVWLRKTSSSSQHNSP